MNEEIIEQVMSNFITVAVSVCAPVLIGALVVGVVIGILQAVTQIQEMTLTFVPKMIAIFAILAALGWWMLGELVGYTRSIFELIPTLVG